MTAKLLLRNFYLHLAVIGTGVSAVTLPTFAQNSVLVFTPVDVRLSESATTPTNKNDFASSTFGLTCPASDLKATVSSTSNGLGKVMVDNFLYLTVTQGDAPPGPTYNLCSDGGFETDTTSCFTAAYHAVASEGKAIGDNPDNFTSTWGVAPINISHRLAPGANEVTLQVVDSGGYLASSSIYLDTNCTYDGVTGPAQISGNPISSTNPTASSLTQTFSFNASNNKVVQQVYDLSTSKKDDTLTIANGTIPIGGDEAIDPNQWQKDYVKGTSFSTSHCLVHSGELLNGSPACKLYTVTCKVGQGSTATGAQCPVSSVRNEVFTDNFDGPQFSLPDICYGGHTFHQGIGYLMASEGWDGGSCVFDPASGLEHDLCPQNILTVFSGPGAYGSKGTTTHPNSTFISVAPVPEDLTSVALNPSRSWSNTHRVKVIFTSVPPSLPQPNNDFVAAPIMSITYGLSRANELPSTEFPVPDDVVLENPVGCPTPGNSGGITATTFRPPTQEVTAPEDGEYLLHYFATDCAGTEELAFHKNSSSSWSTSFYTVPVNVDTVPPRVSTPPELSPPPKLIHGVLGYAVGEAVTVKFGCSDTLSGVVTCGTMGYTHPVTNPPIESTLVNTSTPGTKVFTVLVQDLAGNYGNPKSVSYTVVKQ